MSNQEKQFYLWKVRSRMHLTVLTVVTTILLQLVMRAALFVFSIYEKRIPLMSFLLMMGKWLKVSCPYGDVSF